MQPSEDTSLRAFMAWCAAHPQALTQDSLAHWLRTLVLPRPVLVHTADSVCRQLWPSRAAEILMALDIAGCFETKTNTTDLTVAFHHGNVTRRS